VGIVVLCPVGAATCLCEKRRGKPEAECVKVQCYVYQGDKSVGLQEGWNVDLLTGEVVQVLADRQVNVTRVQQT